MPMPNNQNYEIRNFNLTEIRALDGDEPRIEGIAAVYNAESDDLGGFVEVIEPGFFEDVLQSDVRALFNHDDNLILGRTISGTLSLRDTSQGLAFTARHPDTQLVRDMVITPMNRGDLDQCSFAFWVKSKSNGDDIDGSEWTKREDGTHLRTLKRGGCRALFDVSVVTVPAYPQTSAEARSKFKEIRDRSDPDQPPAESEIDPEDGNDPGGDGAPELQVESDARRRQIELMEADNRI